MVTNNHVLTLHLNLIKCLTQAHQIHKLFIANYSIRETARDLKKLDESFTPEQLQEYMRYKMLISNWDNIDLGNINMLQHQDKIYSLYDELKTLPKIKVIKYEIVSNLLNLSQDKIELYVGNILVPAYREIKSSCDRLSHVYDDALSYDTERMNKIWMFDSNGLVYDETFHFFTLTELVIDFTEKILNLLNNIITDNSVAANQDEQDERVDLDKNNLSAVQKLLLFRFLQKYERFPKKTAYQTDKQELEMIGAAAGATYEDLKKAKPKVEDIMNLRLTKNQIHARVQDLQKVLTVVSGMELTNIRTDIETCIEKLTEMK